MKNILPEFSVSEVSQALKLTLEETFTNIKVKGEISGLKAHSSGHLYFNLKDDSALLNAVCWKGTSTALKIKPEDGLEVICTGKISSYPARSNYQLIASNIEVAGVGALLAMLEQRKKKLEAEGLFDISKKKKLPFLPKRIAVITSPTGAVIRDIIHRISDRFSSIHLMVYGVQVQGQTAADEVSKAIINLNSIEEAELRPDVIIVARGGGSIEDLWAFNEEKIARAVFASHIPIISAVGHETDTTLIDYVADVRAPTPTAAAELAAPVKAQLIQKLLIDKQRLLSALSRNIQIKESKLQTLTHKLSKFTNKLNEAKLILKNKTDIMLIHLNKLFDKKKAELSNMFKVLESYEYKKVLKRGYSIIRTKNNIITSKQALMNETKAIVEFSDGLADIEVLHKKPQDSLF
jgi:exodeoxyribonuclease VII large subunit